MALVLLQLLWLPLIITAAAPPLLVPRPGCRDKCGNVTIPYPFGIGTGCYHAEGPRGFELECDDSHSPPRLSVTGYGHELIDISLLSAEATVHLKASRACYNSTGGYMHGRKHGMALNGSVYLFSSMKSKFVALGCPNLAYFLDSYSYYVTGCMSMCRPSKHALPGPCSGPGGCCQSNIPLGLDFYRPYLQNFGHGSRIATNFLANSTTCAYSFLVDAYWFWYTNSIFNRTDDFVVPVVLDWAIRDVRNCSACQSAQSVCLDSSNGPGYLCNCSSGYEGNPYVHDGCKDIDECQHKDEYPCYGVCTNTPGSYICACPEGSSGNANKQDGCQPKDKFTLALKVVTGVSVGIFLVLLLCFSVYLGLQKRKLIRTKQKFFEQNGGLFLQQQLGSFNGAGATFKIFSETELKKATNNFDEERVIGRGGHGIVYKGVLEDKTLVAIKRSKIIEEKQLKEFAKEMCILSLINHKNVVKLLGCCLEVEVPMLVYEFVSNGNLYHYIHGKNLGSSISSDTRLRIAEESAGALAYMHSSASPPILHGDVKSANILLDDKFTAKVSDFGASKFAPTDEAEVATLVQGTCGYLDPEYLLTCQLTNKSDVYSFGVVMLELLTRKKALHLDGPEDDRSLAFCFLTAMQEGRYLELLDSQVKDEIRVEILDEIADLVMQCLSMTGKERPTMKEVAEKLERLRRHLQNPWVREYNAEEMKSKIGESLCDNVEQKNLHDNCVHYDVEEEKRYGNTM